MQQVRHVGPGLKDDLVLGQWEVQAVLPIIREIIRLWREHGNYERTKERRRFLEVLACFHLRMVQAQYQRGKELVGDPLSICVQHFTLRDCPAQETIQLQVIVEGEYFRSHQKLLKDAEAGNKKLKRILDSITEVQVVDARRTYEGVEILHQRLMNYLLECSKQMNQHFTDMDPLVNEAEVLASLESVLPRKGLLYWMDLSREEKVLQVEELAEVIMGIRVFNKSQGKGGIALQLPHVQFEIDSDKLAHRVQESIKLVNDKVEGFTKGIQLYIQEYGAQHIFIQRLRDELAYSIQARFYLESLNYFLTERLNSVHDYCEKTTRCINNVLSLTNSRKCIPAELVFPELRWIGMYHKTISAEYNLLQSHSKAASSLLDLTERPCFFQSPFTSRRTESGGPLPCIIKDEGVVEQISRKLQYGGFCAVTLVRNEGVLMKGNPKIGVVQVEDRIFSFVDETSLARFLKAPQSFIEGVTDIVVRLPHLMHILRLQNTPTFSFLAISEILETVPEVVSCDFGVQTCVHAIPEHRWDEETLEQRVQELANKRTDSSQTCMETSHFHRESVTQVWPPKEKWTQTGVSEGTTMPRYVRVLHNVRGELHQDFKVVKASYEWP